jgi:uncharacterized membrane protein
MELYLTWLLRILHIGAGIFWVGGALLMKFFLAPTAQATGEAGQKFLAHMAGKMKLRFWLSLASGSTVLAGFILYWIDSNGFQSMAWMSSGAGSGFTIGAIFGAVGFIYGNVSGAITTKMMKLGAQMQGTPSPEQLADMQRLQKRQATAMNVTAYSLILSVVFMSIARYFVF